MEPNEIKKIKFNAKVETITIELNDMSQIEKFAKILRKPLVKRGKSWYIFDGIIDKSIKPYEPTFLVDNSKTAFPSIDDLEKRCGHVVTGWQEDQAILLSP